MLRPQVSKKQIELLARGACLWPPVVGAGGNGSDLHRKMAFRIVTSVLYVGELVAIKIEDEEANR